MFCYGVVFIMLAQSILKSSTIMLLWSLVGMLSPYCLPMANPAIDKKLRGFYDSYQVNNSLVFQEHAERWL